MNSKSAITAITEPLIAKAKKAKPPKKADWLAFSKAADEIAQALNIEAEAAAMTLYGLCATGNVRWIDDQQKVIDQDECTVADFNDKPKWVVASDVRSFLSDWSPDPLPSRREAVIAQMIAEGLIPPRKIKWKPFYKRVRDECNGWLGDRPALGFSDKQIQRIVKDLRSK